MASGESYFQISVPFSINHGSMYSCTRHTTSTSRSVSTRLWLARGSPRAAMVMDLRRTYLCLPRKLCTCLQREAKDPGKYPEKARIHWAFFPLLERRSGLTLGHGLLVFGGIQERYAPSRSSYRQVTDSKKVCDFLEWIYERMIHVVTSGKNNNAKCAVFYSGRR